jgi:hypothetical protein
MSWNHKTTICSIALAVGMVCFSRPDAIAKPAAKAQALWVGGYQYISEFKNKALDEGGATPPNFAFSSSDYGDPSLMTFDRNGNLWIKYQTVNGNLPQIVKLSPANRTAIRSLHHVRARGISDAGFVGSMAFDASGRLWISDQLGKAIEAFLPKQVGKTGIQSPSISITFATIPGLMRFDGADNLWVEQSQLPFNQSNALQLWRFSPDDRAASGPAQPGLMVTLPDALAPADLAFDGAGNLWIAGASSLGDVIEMFTAEDLSGNGEISPSAAVAITSSAFGNRTSFGSCIGGIDFDQAGDLWTSVGPNGADGCGDRQVVEFTAAQLGASGSLTPALLLRGNGAGINDWFFATVGPIRFGPSH